MQGTFCSPGRVRKLQVFGVFFSGCLLVVGHGWGLGGREMTAGKCRAKLQLGGRNEDVNEGLKAGLGTYHGGK